MNERPEELEDDLLSARLKSALGEAPPDLSLRLERMTRAGLRSGSPEPRPGLSWLELGPLLSGAALVIALLIGLVPRIATLLGNPSPSNGELAAVRALASSGALGALAVPIGVWLFVEAMRGAPTVRGWMR